MSRDRSRNFKKGGVQRYFPQKKGGHLLGAICIGNKQNGGVRTPLNLPLVSNISPSSRATEGTQEAVGIAMASPVVDGKAVWLKEYRPHCASLPVLSFIHTSGLVVSPASEISVCNMKGFSRLVCS